MRGTIFSDQKCPVCSRSFVHDDRRRGLFCPDHADQKATSRFIVQFGRNLKKRFSSFESAERFLDGLRYEVDKGDFDHRDYKTSNPLSFLTLSNQYLEKKKLKVKPRYFKQIERYIETAQKYFNNTSVKFIQYAQLEDFIDSLDVSPKTKSNYLACLHNFFEWITKRKEIDKKYFPEFPSIDYELGFRKTIDKNSQKAVIDEVKRISFQRNPKIWLGIKLLCTYISIRPNELRNIRECHIDRKQGILFIPHPKEKRPKIVPLTKEDIEIFKKFPVGLPDLFFFRHGSESGVKAGTPFGLKSFYKWWKRACQNLNIEGVDLYGGTRHSSAVGLREFATPEQIRRATMHSTSKAFERYYMISREELQEIYEATQCDTVGILAKGRKRKTTT